MEFIFLGYIVEREFIGTKKYEVKIIPLSMPEVHAYKFLSMN